MEVILEKYTEGKFKECINLLENDVDSSDNLVESIVKQNCLNVCRCLVIIQEGTIERIIHMQHDLYKTYQNIIALGLPDDVIPVELEVTVLFNLTWWCLLYKPRFISVTSSPVASVPFMRKGLRRVLGMSCKLISCDDALEEILNDVRTIVTQPPLKDYNTATLILEVILLILLYVLQRESSVHMLNLVLETVSALIHDTEFLIAGLKAVKDLRSPNYLHRKLCKFGYLKMNSTVSNPTTWPIDCSYIIKSICLVNLKKFEGVLAALKKNLKSTMKSLWCYLGASSSLMLEDYSQCLGFIIMSSATCDMMLKSRFKILHGQMLSKKGEYMEAIKYFGEAKTIFPDNLPAYYYMGEEYGRIGLTEDMIECFEELLKVIKRQPLQKRHEFDYNIDKILMDLLHPADEITEVEVLYAIAVAYGLNERFEKSTEFFDKCVEHFPIKLATSDESRIINIPNMVTVFHETATVNILTGNLIRAENFLMEALTNYAASLNLKRNTKSDVHVTKNVRWIRELLDQELGTSKTTVGEDTECIVLYNEEMLHFFEEDVIGLMLSAEIQRVQESDMYRVTLGKLVTIFSKYLAQMQGRKHIEEAQRNRLTLAKALTAKVCLSIAKYQVSCKPDADIERTFKRALSCNQGDKDVLYEYFIYLMRIKKSDDAHRLWKTFYKKEGPISIDQCQSLALRYLLKTNINRRELEKIDVGSLLMDVDLDMVN